VSGLNCHAVLRPINAALDETSTGDSHDHRYGRAPSMQQICIAWLDWGGGILTTSLTVTSFCYVAGERM